MGEPVTQAAGESTQIVLLNSVTQQADCRRRVVVCGSHGGVIVGNLAIAQAPRAIVLHDAGIGLANAGVAGLAVLEAAGIAAAAVSHQTARIGEPADMLARGRLSVVNETAARLGLEAGMSTATAVELLRAAPWVEPDAAPAVEARHVLTSSRGARSLVLIDSASLVDPNLDSGAVIVTGSHGGLVGGDFTYGLKARAFAAFFNDAGGGIDDAGFRRLDVLQGQGVPAATVSAESARIGDATSTLAGVVSHTNALGRDRGLRPGERIAEAVYSWIGV